ncbi:MAG: hypothetical protein WBP98_06390, partial [Candidatus Sulfotelmatobacter sp.]
MKFIGLRIFITILEVIAFVLIAPCLVAIGWALFGGDHPLNGQSLTQAAIAIAVVGGVLFMGIVVAALAGLLNLLLAIERNTANAAENTARIGETESKTETPALSRRFPWLQSWHVSAALLVVLAMVVILVYAFSAATSRDAQVKEVSRDEPVANQNSDSYSPERIAGYCRTHPTSFYGSVGSASGISCPDWASRNPVAVAKWPEVKAAERRLFGRRTAEVESLEVMSETLQGTIVISTRCKAHFCTNHSAMWTVDLSTGNSAGEIASDGVMDKTGRPEIVVCLGDYENADALPSPLQEEIKDNPIGNSPAGISYVRQ